MTYNISNILLKSIDKVKVRKFNKNTYTQIINKNITTKQNRIQQKDKINAQKKMNIKQYITSTNDFDIFIHFVLIRVCDFIVRNKFISWYL